MKIQVPKAVGVFAEDTKLLVTDSHALLTFLQVFDVDKGAKTVLAQVAAQVYLPIAQARRLHEELGEALKRKGDSER